MPKSGKTGRRGKNQRMFTDQADDENPKEVENKDNDGRKRSKNDLQPGRGDRKRMGEMCSKTVQWMMIGSRLQKQLKLKKR